MTTVYKHYLIIARLVAERARLVRLCDLYPESPIFTARLVKVSKELMRHQTKEDTDEMREIITMFGV